MKYLLFIFILAVPACATVQSAKDIETQLPTYKPEPLPPPIEEEHVKELPAKDGEPTALMEGQAAPFTGVIIDTHLLAKYKFIKIERDFRRFQIAVEQETRAKIQSYYNGVLSTALKNGERSWWERHAGTLGLVTGVLFTSVLAIGLTYGLGQIR